MSRKGSVPGSSAGFSGSWKPRRALGWGLQSSHTPLYKEYPSPSAEGPEAAER